MSRRSVVLAGGDVPAPGTIAVVERFAPDLVVAADGGLRHCAALGLRADVVVGDLDSADPGEVAAAAAQGARIERHPAEKDASDLELALAWARDAGVGEVLVLGAGGGRLDHFLVNLNVLAAPEFAAMRLEARFGADELTVLHGGGAATVVTMEGEPGDLCTLLAMGGVATGVSTEGLRYPLRGESLHPGSSRGVSNVFVCDVASVTVEEGTLVAIRPGTESR